MKKTHPTYLLFFFLFGLFPLIAFLFWGGIRQTAWYSESISRKASQALELPVRIDAIHHLRPLRVRYEGVQVFEPGSDFSSPLLVIPKLEVWNRRSFTEGKRTWHWHWTVPEMTLETISLETLWRLHGRVLTWGTGGIFWKTTELNLLVDGETQVQTTPPISVQNARLRIFYGTFGPQTDISFSLPDSTVEAGSVPLQLVLQSVQRNASTITVATLKTGEMGIPVPYLISLFPSLKGLGPSSRFTGKIIVQQGFHGWCGLFSGTFQNISLQTALGHKSPLTGMGRLTLDSARFDGSALTRASGHFSCVDGTIQKAFLDRMLAVTQLALRGEAGTLGETVPFRELAFGFQLQNAQIVLTGQCEHFVTGVFLTRAMSGNSPDEEPLVCEPGTPRPAVSAPVFFESIREGSR